ncbi:MAG: LysM peptidoglycan-binding domain-containing protein [Gemmatimonadota bacterium]|nr:LysM peptidoglycan-binding domain-containing protein [Gemmatimonadota bacterium]
MKESEGLYRGFRFLKRLLIGVFVALAGMGVVGYTLFMRRVDAPGAWSAASREVTGGMLHYGERVERWVKAFQRRPTDYYRASNGLLVATNDRVIFVGVAPTDKLESEDAPETIVHYEYPNDTLLTLEPMRVYGMTAKGVRISHPGLPTSTIAATRGEEKAFSDLVSYVNGKLLADREAARRERKLRADIAALINQPIYYTVRRGDALFSIARRFDATPDQIRTWNNIVGDRVRIGDRLIVKPEGPRQTPPPPAPPPVRPAVGTPPSKR